MKAKQEFIDCCRAVVQQCPNPYAKAYAQAGIDEAPSERDPMTFLNFAHTQSLYILSNTAQWRGEVAREVKTRLKSFK